MPRGNPYIWKKHGQSYAELAGTTTAVERAQEIAPRRLPAVIPAMVAELRSTKPAGMPATMLPRGAGSFVMQVRLWAALGHVNSREQRVQLRTGIRGSALQRYNYLESPQSA